MTDAPPHDETAREGLPDGEGPPDGGAPVAVVINARSGTARDLGAPALRARIEAAFAAAGLPAGVVTSRPRDMGRAVEAALAGGARRLIVGGGDGSASYAAAQLAGTGVALGVLPLGTVNLLGRDLDLPADPGEAAVALARGTVIEADLAWVNDRPFHSLSGVGMLARMALERERVRRRLRLGRWVTFALAATRSLRRARPLLIDVAVDGRPRRLACAAVAVTCGAFEGASWSRPRLDAGFIEVTVFHDAPVARRARAAFDMMRGRWRDNADMEVLRASTLTITSPKAALRLSVDGESLLEPTPLRYRIDPGALRLLVPRDSRLLAPASGGATA